MNNLNDSLQCNDMVVSALRQAVIEMSRCGSNKLPDLLKKKTKKSPSMCVLLTWLHILVLSVPLYTA